MKSAKDGQNKGDPSKGTNLNSEPIGKRGLHEDYKASARNGSRTL